MEESSIRAVDGSLQLKRMWLLPLLLLNHVKSDSDGASNVLITYSLFSLTVYIVVSSHNLQYLDLQEREKRHMLVYRKIVERK